MLTLLSHLKTLSPITATSPQCFKHRGFESWIFRSIQSLKLKNGADYPTILIEFYFNLGTSPVSPILGAIGKNYLFLLCNGILILIVKSSGLINGSSSPSSNHGKELYIENRESSREELKVSESEERREEYKCLIKVEEHGEELKNAFMIIGENELDAEEPLFGENNVGIEYPEEVIKSLAMVGGKDDDDDGVSEEEWKNGIMVIWENELDEEEAEKTEELNEKCEAFIRKMKTSFCSERRFDYQNALVPVY